MLGPALPARSDYRRHSNCTALPCRSSFKIYQGITSLEWCIHSTAMCIKHRLQSVDTSEVMSRPASKTESVNSPSHLAPSSTPRSMIFTQNPLTKATGSSLLIPMSRSFAGRTSETHRPVPPRPNPPDRMVLHVSASTRAAAPSGLAHAPSPQGGARDAAAELIYLVSRGMEAACAEADSTAQVANSPPVMQPPTRV